MFPLARILSVAAASALVALSQLTHPLVPKSYLKTWVQSGLTSPSSRQLATSAFWPSSSQTVAAALSMR